MRVGFKGVSLSMNLMREDADDDHNAATVDEARAKSEVLLCSMYYVIFFV